MGLGIPDLCWQLAIFKCMAWKTNEEATFSEARLDSRHGNLCFLASTQRQNSSGLVLGLVSLVSALHFIPMVSGLSVQLPAAWGSWLAVLPMREPVVTRTESQERHPSVPRLTKRESSRRHFPI